MGKLSQVISGLRQFLRTKAGREAAIGIPIVVIWLIWALQPAWEQEMRARAVQRAPIVGLEDMASIQSDHARGEAAFRKALELEWLTGPPRPVPVYDRPSREDYKQARALYLEAVRYGYQGAIGYLGFSYLNTLAGSAYPVDAIKLFELGIKQNDPVSMRGMGLVLDTTIANTNDFYRERNSPYALSLYEKAATLGDVEAQYLAGAMYLNYAAEPDELRQPYLQTVVTPWDLKNEAKGLHWLNKAIEGGDIRAYKVLQSYYERSDPQKSLHYGIEGARHGDTSSLFSLASNFRSEQSTYGRDVSRGKCYETLYDRAVRDRSLRFPDIEQRCPSTVSKP